MKISKLLNFNLIFGVMWLIAYTYMAISKGEYSTVEIISALLTSVTLLTWFRLDCIRDEIKGE